MYKNFGKLFYKIWLESFLSYIFIIVLLFASRKMELNIALNVFCDNIFQLSLVYKWQDAILSLIIEVYMYIIYF